MFDTTVVDKRTTNTNVSNISKSYAANSMSHKSNDTFFVDFEWGSKVAENLMKENPTYKVKTGVGHRENRLWETYDIYKDKPVEVIQMVTMLDRIVAELRFAEEDK